MFVKALSFALALLCQPRELTLQPLVQSAKRRRCPAGNIQNLHTQTCPVINDVAILNSCMIITFVFLSLQGDST